MFETNGDWNNDDEVFKWLSPEWVSGGVGIGGEFRKIGAKSIPSSSN